MGLRDFPHHSFEDEIHFVGESYCGNFFTEQKDFDGDRSAVRLIRSVRPEVVTVRLKRAYLFRMSCLDDRIRLIQSKDSTERIAES